MLDGASSAWRRRGPTGAFSLEFDRQTVAFGLQPFQAVPGIDERSTAPTGPGHTGEEHAHAEEADHAGGQPGDEQPAGAERVKSSPSASTPIDEGFCRTKSTASPAADNSRSSPRIATVLTSIARSRPWVGAGSRDMTPARTAETRVRPAAGRFVPDRADSPDDGDAVSGVVQRLAAGLSSHGERPPIRRWSATCLSLRRSDRSTREIRETNRASHGPPPTRHEPPGELEPVLRRPPRSSSPGGDASIAGTRALVGTFRNTAERVENEATLLAQLRADVATHTGLLHGLVERAKIERPLAIAEAAVRAGFERGISHSDADTERLLLQQGFDRWLAIVATAPARPLRRPSPR